MLVFPKTILYYIYRFCLSDSDYYFFFSVTAASNKQRTAAKDTAKLDRETEELHRMPERYAYAIL